MTLRGLAVIGLVALASVGGRPVAGAPPGPGGGAMLPNLAPLPPFDVSVGPGDAPAEAVPHTLWGVPLTEPPGPALRFSTTVQNRGAYSLDLRALPAPDVVGTDVYAVALSQCVRFQPLLPGGAPRGCERYAEMGVVPYHPAHHHLHLDGLLRYELRRDAKGRPDLRGAGLVRASDKAGLCLSDMWDWRGDRVRDVGDPRAQAVFSAATAPAGRAWYRECSAHALAPAAGWRQGVSPGWLDTGFPYMPGQQIPLAGVVDGVYWIVVTLNQPPRGKGPRLWESTWADNTAASRIQVYGGGRKARLLSPLPPAPNADWYDNPEDQPGD